MKITHTYAIIFMFSLSNLYAINSVTISGSATYYDVDSESIEPIKEVRIVLETENPVVNMDIYTDIEGNYSFTLSDVWPEVINVRLYYANSKIEVQGYLWEPYEDSQNIVPDYPEIGECDPPEIPCDFEYYYIPYINFSYAVADDNNNYAKIFMLGNIAVDFALLNGLSPLNELSPINPAIIRFPAESSIVAGYTIEESIFSTSFFWPYMTASFTELENFALNSCDVSDGFLWLSNIISLIPLPLIGLEYCFLTFGTTYLVSDVANPGQMNTVFHEIGHWVHRYMLWDFWPVDFCEYASGEEVAEHSFNQYDLSEKQAFIEGWADFYASAVEDYYNNQQYSGMLDGDTGYFEYISSHDGSVGDHYFDFNSVENGINNEVTVAGAFFDLYDPVTGGDDDYSQIPLSDIFSYLANHDNTTALELFEDMRADKTYNALAPFFYSLEMNRIEHDMPEFSNYYDLEMHNRAPDNYNLSSSLLFEDSDNLISININSAENQKIPLMIGSEYTVVTNLLDHEIFTHLNWNTPEFYMLRVENFEIEPDPIEISANFEEKHNFLYNYEPMIPIEINDPWWIDPEITAQHFPSIFHDLSESDEYEVFLNQNVDFDPVLPIYALKAPQLFHDNSDVNYIFDNWKTYYSEYNEDLIGDIVEFGSDCNYNNCDVVFKENIVNYPNHFVQPEYTPEMEIIFDIPEYYLVELQDHWHYNSTSENFEEISIQVTSGGYSVFPGQTYTIGSESTNQYYIEYNNIYAFSHWSGTNVSISSPSSAQTNIIFHEEGASLTLNLVAINTIPNTTITNLTLGETIEIPSGATINFANGFTFDIQDTFTISGDANDVGIFTSSNGGSGITFNVTGKLILNNISIDGYNEIHLTNGEFSGNGITLSNANDYAIYGDNSKITLSNSLITNCTNGVHSVKIDNVGSYETASISNTTITGTSTSVGIGLYIQNGHGYVDKTVITDFEYGIRTLFPPETLGGGLRSVIIDHSTIFCNTTDIKTDNHFHSNCNINCSILDVTDFGSNSDYSYTNFGVPDPLFVDPDNRNFHLQPNSPCIDAGYPGSQGVPHLDPDGTIADMGAYYFFDAAPPPVPANLTKSGGFGQHPTLSWDPVIVADFDHYVLRTEYNGPNNSFTDFVSLTATSYTDLAFTIQKFGSDIATYSVCAVDWTQLWSDFTNVQNVNGSGGGMARSLDGDAGLPTEYTLHSAYPNPFNPLMMIDYDLPESGFTKITIYDMTGHEVDQLVKRIEEAGYHTVKWNASQFASGAYLVKMTSGEFTQTQKVALVK